MAFSLVCLQLCDLTETELTKRVGDVLIAAASHTQNSASLSFVRVFKLCRIKQQFGIKIKKLTSLVTLPGTGTDRRGRNSSYHKNHNWWRWERQEGNEVQNSIGQQGRVEIKVR